MLCVVLTSVFVQFTIYGSYFFFIIILNYFYDLVIFWPLFVIFVSSQLKLIEGFINLLSGVVTK